MTNYQKQVDIDKLYDLIWNAETNSVRFASKVSNEKLTNDLTNLRRNLVSFNDLLMKFNGDSTGLAQDLTSFRGNLNDFLNSVDEFHTDLVDYKDELDDFKDELTGEGGFTDLLGTLETYMYGGEGYSYQNPSSNSLKGMLINLQDELGKIVSGDQQLAIDMADMVDFLNGFTGTIDEFKAELDRSGIDSSKLNQGLLQLSYRVSTMKTNVETHKGRLDDFDDLIGTETDSAKQGDNTVFGILNDTSDVADATSQKADTLDTKIGDANSGLTKKINDNISNVEDIQKLAYKGDSGTGTPEDPVSNTIMGQIGDANSGLTKQINDNIANVNDIQKLAYKGTSGTGTPTNPVSNTIMGQIGNETQGTGILGDIKDINDNIGDVDSNGGDLQTQIAKIVNDLIYGESMTCPIVETIEDRDNLNPRFYRVCYVKSTQKYYKYNGDDILGG